VPRNLARFSFGLGGLAILLSMFGWSLFLMIDRRNTSWMAGVCLLAGLGAALAALVSGVAARAVLRTSLPDEKAATDARAGIGLFFIWLVGSLMAVMVVPSFLPASGPSRVARAKSEIRNLAVNLETYYIDHNSYPPAVDINGRIIPIGESAEDVSAGYVPWLLTTPIAYTSSLPTDPFYRIRRGYGQYRYATNGSACWIMTSRGPDEDDDIAIKDYPSPGVGDCQFRKFMSQFGGPAVEYDGTNGTTSSGDVVRVGP